MLLPIAEMRRVRDRALAAGDKAYSGLVKASRGTSSLEDFRAIRDPAERRRRAKVLSVALKEAGAARGE